VGVAAAPGAGEELELEVGVRVDDAADDEDEDDDDERADGPAVDGVAFAELLVADEDGAADELSAVGVAGAVGVGEDGVVVVSEDDEALVSSRRVVVPDEDEFPTSADTGFCPISSIPVTIAIATTNTETA
jgi:hypothetical protein